MTLTIGSMFSGYGGLDMGVCQVLDAETAWFCEWDDAPSKILAHHWPDVPNYRDVTTVDWANVPPVDIITGGSPCQDLSLAGARRGMTAGTRSNLWVAMREAIATIRPRLVVWENVRGALSATATSESDMEPGAGLLGGGTGHLRALGRVLGDLASIGYDAQWQLLRASDVGAPHHRARVFLVAYPADTGSVGLQAARRGSGSSASLAGSVGGAGALPALNHLPTPRCSDSNVAGAHGAGGADLRTAILDLGAQPYLPTPTTGYSGRSPEEWRDARPAGNGARREAIGDLEVAMKEVAMKESVRDFLPIPRASDPANASSHATEGFRPPLGEVVRDFLPTPTCTQRGPDANLDTREGARANLHNSVIEAGEGSVFGKYEPVVHRWEAVTGMSAPAPTELNKNGRPRLNAAFAEWMMGLPSGWVTQVPGVTRAQQLKACGNGVVPQQAAAALRHLLEEIA